MPETFHEATYKTILDRIEVISQELEELRQLVLMASSSAWQGDCTNELLGSLGTDSIEAYDFDLDWRRFDGSEMGIR